MKKIGFTLAEVLITLGIVGVVAALVMPGVIIKTQEQTLRSQRLKAVNNLANGIKLSEAHADGSMESIPLLNCFANSFGTAEYEPCLDNAIKDMFNPLYTKYSDSDRMSLMSVDYRNFDGSDMGEINWGTLPDAAFVTKDGALFDLGYSATTDIPGVPGGLFYLDVNGIKGPNAVGKDFFIGGYTFSGRVELGIPGPDEAQCATIKGTTWDTNSGTPMCMATPAY